MKVNPAVQGGAEQGSARVGRGQGASLPMDAFQALLNQVESRTRFSAHAKARIEQRGVDLTADDLARIDDAVDRMAAKGVRDALIYMSHGLAMVVSVKNRTVITALDDASAKENIFTNIDSAAIL
jgi:flagellar operon protein|nr:TIGR02530 family flagellar biosynthesis protein [uncultured Selenomonas sp.]